MRDDGNRFRRDKVAFVPLAVTIFEVPFWRLSYEVALQEIELGYRLDLMEMSLAGDADGEVVEWARFVVAEGSRA